MYIKWPGEISPTSVFQGAESHLWLSPAFQQDTWLQRSFKAAFYTSDKDSGETWGWIYRTTTLLLHTYLLDSHFGASA